MCVAGDRCREYGLTASDHGALFNAQVGCCDICGLPPGKKALAVDHDHAKPGLLRALLCDNCNRALGCFRDSPALLRKAAEYVEYFKRLHADLQTRGLPRGKQARAAVAVHAHLANLKRRNLRVVKEA